MKTILLFVSTLLFTTAFSQTKWIAHKSHSGDAASFWADPATADFGPGVGYIERIEHDTSDIVLKTICNQYPVVKFHKNKPSMQFLDEKDSLIGCDRPYAQYLWAGTIVYSEQDSKFFLYDRQLNPQESHAPGFQDVTDSVAAWSKKGWIHDYKTHIFSGGKKNGLYDQSRHRSRFVTIQEIILVNYPALQHDKLQAFKMQLEEQKEALLAQSGEQPKSEETSKPKQEQTTPVLPCMVELMVEHVDTLVEQENPIEQPKTSITETPKKEKGTSFLYILGAVLLGGLIFLILPKGNRISPRDY